MTSQKSKELIRPMPTTWWLGKKSYLLFMVRELTCVFVGAYALLLLVLVSSDQQTFASILKSPVSIVAHLVALPMVLYHSITWFNLTPKVMVLWRGEERVSPTLIAGSNYLVWLVVSIVVAGIAFLYG